MGQTYTSIENGKEKKMTDQEMLPNEESTATNETKDINANRETLIQGTDQDIEASTVEITLGGVNEVNADQVYLRLSGARTLDAENIKIRQGAALQLEAETVEATGAAMGFTRADQATINSSRVAGLFADTVSMNNSTARIIVTPGGDQVVDQSAVGALVTQKATVRNGIIGVLIAGKVEGEYQTLLDPQAALAFGAAFGTVMALILRLTRRKKKKRN
jgi:hypothetical protein